MKKIFILFLLISITSQIKAQTEISFKTGIELPMGYLNWVYKVAPSYSIAFSKLKETNKGFVSLGLGVGYFQLEPHYKLFSYQLNELESGSVFYSNYKVVQIFVPIRIDLTINKRLAFFNGIDIGYYFISYHYQNYNLYQNEVAFIKEGKAAVAPKSGINLSLLKNIGLSLQVKYHLYFSFGEESYSSPYFNAHLGKVNHFLSGQLGGYVRF